jgi:hypothetical protein
MMLLIRALPRFSGGINEASFVPKLLRCDITCEISTSKRQASGNRRIEVKADEGVNDQAKSEALKMYREDQLIKACGHPTRVSKKVDREIAVGCATYIGFESSAVATLLEMRAPRSGVWSQQAVHLRRNTELSLPPIYEPRKRTY